MDLKKYFWLPLLVKISVVLSKQVEETPINYEGHKFISVMINNEAQINQVTEFQKIYQDGVELWENNFPLKKEVSFIVGKEHSKIFENEMKMRNITYNITHSNLGELIRKERSLPDDYSKVLTYKFDKHNPYYAIENYMKRITARNWKVAKLFKVGTTFENRPIYGVQISRGQKWRTKKVIVFECGIHSREWTSVEACIYVMQNFIEPSKGDAQSLFITRNYHIIIIPVINPDGYIFTWEKSRLWRKTRSCHLDKVACKGICVGVDANRNFASGFGRGRTSSNPCTVIYRGPSHFSEKESLAEGNLLMKLRGRLIAFFSFHSYGPLWLIPYSNSYQKPRNYNDMERVAKAGARELAKISGTVFTVGTAPELLYLCGGTSMDFAYDYGKAKYSYTLELRKGDDVLPFIVPEKQILPTCKETYVGVKAAILAFDRSNELYE